MIIVDGKKIADEIIIGLKQKETPKKFLAVFASGVDKAAQSFIARKKKVADELGVDMRMYDLDAFKGNDDARKYMRNIVSKKRCGGAILQLPLPARFNAAYLANVIAPRKDIDALSARTIGAVCTGRENLLPPAVKTVLRILSAYDIPLVEVGSVAIIGQGTLTGKPIAQYLSGKVSQLIILDKGADLTLATGADMVISGTGVPGLIRNEHIKEGAIVVDFGYGEQEGKLKGDVHEDVAGERLPKLITPVPGGTGPILVAELLDNFYTACQNATHA